MYCVSVSDLKPFHDYFPSSRVDRMMNSMMRGMFHDPMMDPFGMHHDMMSMSPFMNGHNQRTGFSPSAMQSFSMSSSPGSSGYFSSSVTSVNVGPDGRPQVYQQSSSEMYAPGGVRETRQSVRDSMTGHQAMRIGHHIRDRGHIMAQTRNAYSGEREENQEYINLEEEEAETFENEFRNRWSNNRHHRHDAIDGHRRHGDAIDGHRRHGDQLALPAPPSHRRHSSNQQHSSNQRQSSDPEPIIEFPPDSPPQATVGGSSSRCPSRGSTPGKERRSKKREKKPYKK